MASPFSSFRKHQKKMLAFLGVLCMIVFVVGSSAMSCVEGPGTRTNAVVATTKYDTYRETDVRQLVYNKQVFNRFVTYARREAGLPERMLSTPTEESAVQTKILADLAGTMGIVVSDEAINKFMFRDIVEDNLNGAQMKAVLRKYDISEVALFNALRNELLASQLQLLMFPEQAVDSFQRRPPNVTPAERWEYYLRINRQSHVEILRVPVASFVDQVEDPDEETLRAFFEEHKQRLPDPASPVPGFRRPPLAAFQTIFADFNTFYEEEKPKVTQAQIEEYYQENRDPLYRYTGFDEPEDDSPVRAPDPETDGPVAAPEPVPGDAGQPGGAEANPGAGDDPCQAEPPGDDGAPPEGSDDDPSQDNPPQDDPSQDDPPADGGATEDETPPEPPTPLATLKSDLLTIPRDITAGPDPEFDPLWKVEDSIRETLARQAAEERIDEALGKIRRLMGTYYRQWTQWEVIGEGPEPEKPDLEQLAAEAGMQLRPATELMSVREALETDLGQTTVDLGLGSSMPFARAAYLNLGKYQPGLGTDTDDNRYLFWIVDEREGYTPAWNADEQENGKPPLIDRAEVVRAWKMIQARQPAHERAEALAAEARKSGKPLTEMRFDDQPGEALQPFSWMTRGNVYMPPRQSEVEGVENAGEEFMRTVFDLQPGELGVAFDEPQTTAYVIRLTDVTMQVGFGGSAPLDAQAHSRFYTSPFSLYQGAANEDYDELFGQWIRRINDEVGLEWKRQPDSQQ